MVGVIGHNGAGKSTLMNLVSGILLPTTGSIALSTDKVCRIDQGGVLSTQETGRENIRMQLALYGVPVADTVAETDAIAAFADLHEQPDSPVGTYSAGMRGRPGFAISARLLAALCLVCPLNSLDLSVAARGFKTVHTPWLNNHDTIYHS